MPRRARSSRPFAPSLVVTLPLLLGVLVLARLGAWQLGRAAEARALAAAFAQGAGEPAALPPAARAGVMRYARVRLTGHYVPARQFLLDNMTHDGRAGYRVLTPFAADGGALVLVDRGWLPQGPTRAALPEVAVDEDPRSLTGRIDVLPRPGLRLGGGEGRGWPRLVSYPTDAELAHALDRPLYPGLVLLDSAERDGYVRDWRPGGLAPERHVGYALQWFALALTLLVAGVVLAFRRRDA